VLRSTLLFAPFLAVTLVALAFLLQDTAGEGVSGGRIVGLALVGSVALLLGYQVIQSVRDLFSQLVETTGLVERRWSRNEFLLFRNSYIFVDRNVFRLPPEQLLDIDCGDLVRIVHYPHTGAVERIERVRRGADGGSASDD
jgi:hypothetical protein